MAVHFPTAYDFTLTVDGNDYGFLLYVDPQTSQRHLNEGLAPMLTPQQRVTEFGYEHIPPEIDIAASYENWSDGAGYVEYTGLTSPFGLTTSNSNAPRVYNFSRGLDLSWNNRIYVSPARNTDLASTGGAVAAAPTFYWNSITFGYWLAAGVYLYKYDLTSAAWVLKLTASAAITSIAELSGVMYVSITGVAYQYTTDGTTFTVATLSGSLTSDIADLFVVRRSSLWAMRSELLYATTNGQNGGVNWSAGTAIGSTSELTQSMVTVADDIWVFKREGIYNFDGTTGTQVWTAKYLSTTNGKYSYIHSDGNIYVVYGSEIIGLNPFVTTETPMRIVYPAQRLSKSDTTAGSHDSQEIKGTISQITGTFHELFFTVTNPNGRTYLMKGDPDTQVYHTYAYLGTETNAACFVAGPGVQHSANPCLSLGYSTGAIHYILPRSELRPEDDPNYRFDTTTGSVYGPWMGYGARAFMKFLNRGTILGLNLTAGQTATLGYELDDSGTVTTLVTAIDGGTTTAQVTTAVEFNRLRYYLTMSAVADVQSPILLAATLHATLNPPRNHMWRPLVRLAPQLELRDGTFDNQDPHVLLHTLFDAANKRITLTNSHNMEYVVKLLDIQEQVFGNSEKGGEERDTQVFQLVFAEITSLTSDASTGHYGADVYGGGKVRA